MTKQEELQNIQVKLNSFECSITADITVFGYVDGKLKILLIKRSFGHYKDHWHIPGGVMEANETIEDCAAKVLFALTGFRDIHFEQVKTYSAMDRHPLKRVITVCFYALVKPENHPLALRDNVTRIDWFDVDKLPEKFGYDHEKLIKEAYSFVRNNLKHKLIVGELLPKTFTLQELQSLYEDILDIKLDRRNFRKRIFQMDVLVNTEKKKPGAKGGPFLYRLK
ncbi:NUDIX hydrolase [Allomuricauda sp. SCSIO 65647]|uniref:NUDIX hydrolase n=1 Tax=Allomuricauda sp. SCSIO 65647 TaxID=2908843 RepID=UPI001F2644B0|nr:NUDIX domain-containing protein [Muricauda sp. SCSIO 65647]UJH68596.1 NUDIX domain-containing protein [Muricauda sp. SCSIO 65647]